MPEEKKIPGSLVDAIKLRKFQKKCSYAKAAREVLEENPGTEKTAVE